MVGFYFFVGAPCLDDRADGGIWSRVVWAYFLCAVNNLLIFGT